MNLKLPSPLKSVAAHYLAKRKWSTIWQYIHISDNNMLPVRQYLFHELLFVYLFFFSLILTPLLHYCNILFVALLNPFSYEDKRLA